MVFMMFMLHPIEIQCSTERLRTDIKPRIIPKKLVKNDLNAVMDEINVLKGLDHPHIVHVWDHFESRDK